MALDKDWDLFEFLAESKKKFNLTDQEIVGELESIKHFILSSNLDSSKDHR